MMCLYFKVCKFFGLGLILLVLWSCMEPFEPKIADAPGSYLVVDGAINSQGVSTIRLSRTTGLGQSGKAPAVSKARVFIEEASGRQYLLTESPAGTYTSASLILPAEKAIRLHFTTADGREYASDFTPAKFTPSIDSVSWRINDQGLQIYVNAHDETNQARYYRWSYEETWEFRSRFVSYLEYKNKKLVDRLEDINHCWGLEAPSTIMLGNTVRLSRNVVAEQPITLLPKRSTKLVTKYSVLVRQYALSLEEYNYLEALRKNTESIGTLFDPLPTQLTGNVHCIQDASEVVLGFVGAQSVQEQRIFIDRSDLPADWPLVTGYEGCGLDTTRSADFFADANYTPIAMGDGKVYYSTSECIDCRKRGANVRPSFWK